MHNVPASNNVPDNVSESALNSILVPEIKYVSVPYNDKVFHKLKFLLKKFNIHLVAKPYNTIGNRFFSKLKDKVPMALQSNIIYQVTCSCNAIYVGQTRQYLKDRINDHVTKNSENSALSEHLIQFNHKLNEESAKILAKERNLYKRLIKEMIFIKTSNNLNKQADCIALGDSYDSILRKIKN